MSLRPSNRIVLASIPLAVCVVPIRENAVQILEVDVSACCVQTIEPCIVQGAAKTLQFRDLATVDYSDAAEITVDIWANGIGGASIYSKTFTGGGGVTLADTNIFQVTISNAESAAFAKGKHHCEAWVTLSTGERRCVGLGPFTVTDSRKHD